MTLIVLYIPVHAPVIMMVLMLAKVSLLLRSGDVERNPGPGLFPGELYFITILRAVCVLDK